MGSPKVITLEAAAAKSTVSFEVRVASRVVIESQLNTNYGFSAPVKTMTITTDPLDDTAVPSLIDDTTSSGTPSEDSQAIRYEDNGSTSSGSSWSLDIIGSTDSVLSSQSGRASRTHRGHSKHRFDRTVSSNLSGSNDTSDFENSSTSQLESISKRPTALERRGLQRSKGCVPHSVSGRSHSTEGGDDYTPRSPNKPQSKASRWTESQNELLKSMKDGGEAWATIAAALGRGKREVKARYKSIESTVEERSGTDGINPKMKAYCGKARSPEKHKKGWPRRHRKSARHAWRKSDDGSTSASPGMESIDSDAQQQMYLQDQIRENLYPPYLALKEDGHFAKRDCEILATVDSKMKRGKWLEMQANFFNVTGKMVPISVFRDKCEAAEAEECERIRETKIKSWEAGLDYSEQFDPNEPCRLV